MDGVPDSWPGIRKPQGHPRAPVIELLELLRPCPLVGHAFVVALRGDVGEWPPVGDVLDDHVVAVSAMIDGAFAPTALRDGCQIRNSGLPNYSLRRVGYVLPDNRRGGRCVEADLEYRVITGDVITMPLLFERPTLGQILNENRHLTDSIECLCVGDEPEDAWIYRHRVQDRLGVDGIGGFADHRSRRPLGEAMNQDHVGSSQLLGSGNLSDHVLAVVDEEFEVE